MDFVALRSISSLGPWRMWVPDAHSGDYVLEVLCFKFQISRMSGTLSRTSLSIISWLDPWEDIWFLMPNLEIDYVLEV